MPKRRVPPKTHPKSSRQKVQEHRDRLRELGMRPIQIWVPDVRSKEFAAAAHRQSRAAARAAGEADEQAFIDAITSVPE